MVTINSFLAFCKDSFPVEWWFMLLISIAFLMINSFFFLLFANIRESDAIEFGYPNTKSKTVYRRIKKISRLKRILLIKVTAEAERKGFFLYLNFLCAYLNILGMILSFAGCIACLITCVKGWAIILLTMPVIVLFFVSIILMFIPDLIWLPSERRRYGFTTRSRKKRR